METLLRQWAMLKLVPRHPRRIDTVAIREKLQEREFDVTLRTIQRDLNQLSRHFPLESDQSKPQGWWWSKDAAVMDIPGLDPQSALVFKMVEEHLRTLLPTSTLDILQPWFKSARGVLEVSDQRLSQWPDKIRVLPKGMQLLPPKIDPLIQSLVYQGLLDERWMRISYRARGSDASRIHEVNPLALVQRGSLIYLVGTIGIHTNPALMLLHRMESAEILDRPAESVEGFDLDRFIGQGELNFRLGLPIKLVADFAPNAAITLVETPLSFDQTMELLDNQWVRITANIPDTLELRAWLRSFGAEVVVINPEKLISN